MSTSFIDNLHPIMYNVPMTIEFKPVPLEEVVGIDKGLYSPDGTLTGTTPLRWGDLNGKEQLIITAIRDGRYSDAAFLSGDGKNSDYSPWRVQNFLVAVSQQHQPLGLSLGNVNVCIVTHQPPNPTF